MYYHISTFSEHGSFLITSGAIHATVPAKDIFVDFSFQVRLVPKSDIFTTSFLATRTLGKIKNKFCLTKVLIFMHICAGNCFSLLLIFFYMHIYDRIICCLNLCSCMWIWMAALLRWLEVPVNDLVTVKVVHATGYLLGPVEDQSRWDLLPVPQDFVQLTVGTVLHDDAITWSLRTHTPMRQKNSISKNTDIEAFSLDFKCIFL